MPRGRRRTPADVGTLEQELDQLKRRQSELRQQIRRMKNSQGEVGKLEEKLSRQLATDRWTASQIQQLNQTWDEVGCYQYVAPKQPAPRGRRRRATEESA